MGRVLHVLVESRIADPRAHPGEDIAAVKPNYAKKFGALAKRTRLELLVWKATEEVKWVWRFEHVGSKPVGPTSHGVFMLGPLP